MKVVRLRERLRPSTGIDQQHELLTGIRKKMKIILMKNKTKTKKRKTREKMRNIMMKVGIMRNRMNKNSRSMKNRSLRLF